MKAAHGGDWAAFYEQFHMEPLDFSANTSPLGLPDGVKRAVIASLEKADVYPDPGAGALRRQIAEGKGISPDWILCGNGAADLIWRLADALRPGTALITAPTFGEYRAALEHYGCRVNEYVLKEADGFKICEDLLEQITKALSLLVLCEPNNPTGLCTDRDLLMKIVKRCKENGTLLLVDECFQDFLEEPQKHTLLRALAGYPVMLLKAFTKFYGMAGLRLGYVMCADQVLLERMKECGQPWPVSSAAQAAGIAALKEEEYAHELRQMIPVQRALLYNGLTALGCVVIPGEANYLLFRYPCAALRERLQQRGILIRGCGDYHGLSSEWYRIAVRGEQENLRLLQAMKEVIGHAG